jgi:CheY-like chemotaxis protein
LKNGGAAALSITIALGYLVVIVAVDDLMFASRISSTAKALGVAIRFARSPESIVEAVRSGSPRLVIFDLNSRQVRPLEAIASLKADPELAAVPTIGFVSHVEAELIAEARAAGFDQVMARSAFVTQLPQLLQGA